MSTREDLLADVVERLRAAGVRAELDDSDDRFNKKIRNATTQKVPFVLIAGGEDAEAGAVSFRFRDGTQRKDRANLIADSSAPLLPEDSSNKT